MQKRNHLTHKFIDKSSSDLEDILNSEDVREAKLAAKWILDDRRNSPNDKSADFSKKNYPEQGTTFFEKLTSYDKSKLKKSLTQVGKKSKLDIVINGVLSFVAPYLAVFPGQTPLIKNMNYWEAVVYFAVFLSIITLITYLVRAYGKIRALQSDRKKVIVARVLSIDNSNDNKSHLLTLQHEFLEEYKLPLYQKTPKMNDYVRLEFSDLGNQLIKIKTISEKEYLELFD